MRLVVVFLLLEKSAIYSSWITKSYLVLLLSGIWDDMHGNLATSISFERK